MRRLLSQAPEPRSAVNISCRIGSNTTPTTISPARSSASVTLKMGRECAKLVVPSNGSTYQRYSDGLVWPPPSSAQRVHVPAVFRWAGMAAAFLGHDAVLRKAGLQPLDHQFFGCAIGFRDQVEL